MFVLPFSEYSLYSLVGNRGLSHTNVDGTTEKNAKQLRTETFWPVTNTQVTSVKILKKFWVK